MINNKFTIIVPTRERCETLYHTLRICLNQTYQNYEILVSDNYSQDDTKKIVHSFDNEKIHYINTGKRVSMSENFEFALSHVSDGYLMFIGDDDGMLPNSLEYVNDIINKTKCEAVVSLNAFYTWPETTNPNKLMWSPKSGYEIRDSKVWIEKYLTFQMQYTFDLPSAYCGFVKKEVFERASKDGLFFRSSTPDSYSALAVAFFTDKYVYSHSAFAVHGSSANSNGAAGFANKKNYIGNEYKKFLEENKIPFHKKMVMCKTFRTYSLEAYFQFSDAFPELTKEYTIDWKLFLQYVLSESQENTKEDIEEAVKKMCEMHSVDFEEIKNFRVNRFSGLTLKEIVQKAYQKIIFKLSKKSTNIEDTTKYGVYNVHDAMLLMKFVLEFKNN